jgi:hypothetical protein
MADRVLKANYDATEVVVFKDTVGHWRYEPRDARGRAAWPFDLEWNRTSSLFRTKEQAVKIAGHFGLPVRIEDDGAVTVKPRKGRK